jgi:hypothetical protein
MEREIARRSLLRRTLFALAALCALEGALVAVLLLLTGSPQLVRVGESRLVRPLAVPEVLNR